MQRTNTIGSEIAGPPRKVESLHALMKLKPTKGNKFCTFAFALNRDMIKEDGTLDDLHAVVFPLASFDNEESAHNYVRDVIQRTGHSGIIASKFGAPVQLTSKFDPENTTEVVVTSDGVIVDLESAQYERDKAIYEENIKRETELLKEAEAECDPEDIEHFKRQAYLAIKNLSGFKFHLQKAKEFRDDYLNRRDILRDHYKRHPEHEERFIPYLEEKLTQRGELNLYNSIEHAYSAIREELLDIKDDTHLHEVK